MKKEYFLLLLVAGFLAVVVFLSLQQTQQKQQTPQQQQNLQVLPSKSQKKENEEKTMPATLSANKTLNAPELSIDQNKNYQVSLHTTQGDIVIELDVQHTPIAANNFVYLAEQHFYDQTIFHRVIKGFMIQGGDPRGDGTGGPGYRFANESFPGEYVRGAVAMANAGPDTNGSQFFIMQQDYPLPKDYVIFGQVISGMEVVDQIANAAVTNSFSGELSKPVSPVVVESVSVAVN